MYQTSHGFDEASMVKTAPITRNHLAVMNENGRFFFAEVGIDPNGAGPMNKIIWRADPRDATPISIGQAEHLAGRFPERVAAVRRDTVLANFKRTT